MASIAVAFNTISTKASIEIASLAKTSGLSPDASFFENIGTKAMLKAPSAKNLRNRLGSEKAKTNASATGVAPKAPAMKTSRTKPNTRDTRVQNPTVKNPRIMLMTKP